MYDLSPEAGGGRVPALKADPKMDDLFRSYIQTKERLADLIQFDFDDLLNSTYRRYQNEPYWRMTLSYVADLLAEEGKSGMKEIAPENSEGMVRFYDLYGKACMEAANTIDEYLEGSGSTCEMTTALGVLKAHNDARDAYLEIIEFPAWLGV